MAQHSSVREIPSGLDRDAFTRRVLQFVSALLDAYAKRLVYHDSVGSLRGIGVGEQIDGDVE